jgi:hypothetical protein
MDPAREVLAAEVLAAPPEQELAAAGVTNKVTVVMMVPAGGAPEAGRTWEQVVAEVNGRVADYWRSQTGGAVEVAVVGTKHDWATASVTCSNPYGLWNEAAARAGWTGGAGQHLLVYLPRNSAGCSYGLAEMGGSPGAGGRLYVTDVATSVMAHELGHNFGLGHSSGRQCDQGTETGSCRDVAYRDYYDVMGVSGPWVGALNAPQAARMGVLPVGQQVAVTAPATSAVHTLSPYAARTGTRAIKLTDAAGVIYWLEYRTATDQDAWLATSTNYYGLQQGVQLRRAQTGQSTSLLLDPTPSPSSGWNSDWKVALPVGVPVRVSGSTFTVTVESAGASGAAVRIASIAGDIACGARSPVPMSGVALTTVSGSATALVVGQDRGLWLRPIDGGSTSWQSLGGRVLFGPAGAYDGVTSYVFVTGLDGALFYRASSGRGWSPWVGLGGVLTGSPAAASLAPGHLRVFGRGLDGGLWSRELNAGSWSGWQPHGGYLSSPPTATADTASSRIEVVVRGLDGLFSAQSLTVGAGVAAYTRRDLMACSALALSPVRRLGDSAGGAFIDSRGAPRLLEATGSRTLGGVVTSTPAVQFFGGEFVLVGRGSDGALWLYDGRSGASGWSSLGGYVI